MLLETYMKLGMTEPDFQGKIFCPQNWENGPKTGFFNLLANLTTSFY